MSDTPAPRAFDALIRSPFARLRSLLDGITPEQPVIDLGLGEPRHGMPGFVAEILQAHYKEFEKYPPIAGTPELISAITGWLERRYPGLAGHIDGTRHILPLNGSREGLFSIMFPLLGRWRESAPEAIRPAVLIPNPFYQAYAAAAYAAGAEPVFLDTSRTTGFLPDLDLLAENHDLLERTAAIYLCSPSNPQGAVAQTDYWDKAIRLARKHGITVLADECYSEIYRETPPPGALETALAATGNFDNVIAFQSLSKRSNLPGLRSGFCAGDEHLMAAFGRFRNVACPQMPLPVQFASARAWQDEEHVTRSRAAYGEKFDDAAEILSELPGFELPDGAFFLWLDASHAGGGEKAAQTLFEKAGIRVLPGRYLSHVNASGRSPGDDFIRIALVDDREKTRGALQRITETFA